MIHDRNIYYKELALYYKNTAIMFRNDAAVHVEAAADESFWKKVFEYYHPDKTFNFITFSRTRENAIATGCAMCLKYKDLGCLSKEFFVCIDSDYRYLLREKSIDTKNFVFQTYTYSIENHWCYPEGINKAFEKIGLNNRLFDFEVFLKWYSQALYELFIYHLLSVSKKDYIFNKKLFRSFLNIEPVNLKNSGKDIIDNLKAKIEPELSRVKALYPVSEFEEIKQYYLKFGINKDNAYLYFRGHNVFEQVILKIANKVKMHLERNIGDTLADEEKESFFSIRRKLSLNLQDNICFDEYPEINRIKNDIQLFFN